MRTLSKTRFKLGCECPPKLFYTGKKQYANLSLSGTFTGGPNSIEYVLPAVLQRSDFLQRKYTQPVYGAEGGIPSLNFSNWRWIEFDDGAVVDPYSRLPRLFQDLDPNDEELLSDSDELRDGASAMTTYARMQFEEMGDAERRALHDALLRYCELDTMAMVMIFESWKDGFGL